MTYQEILSFAEKQIGVVEKYDNDVVYNTEYYGRKVSGSEYPWCCVFIWYLFNSCGAADLFYDGKKTATCQTLADWFKKKGQWYTTPKVGDIVFFKFGNSKRYTNHVGIVKNVKSNGTIDTIEGNTSTADQNNGGMVMQRTRKSNIVGYGRPAYSTPSQAFLYKGVDVSAAQTNLNYATLKNEGVEFAILKIIRKDLNKDKMFEKHYQGFTQVGIPIFCVYNYSYATSVDKARNDAKTLIQHLEGRKLAVCLDVEDKVQQNLGSKLIDIINAYHEEIAAAGLPFLLYTGMSFYNSFIKPWESSLKCKDIWMARYYLSYETMLFSENPNERYKPMSNLVGWQYTSSGHIPGYNSNLDFDVIYRDIEAPSIVVNNIETKVLTKGSRLNVRLIPKTGKVVDSLVNGTVVKIVDVQDTWFKLGEGKYVSPDYITTNSRVKIIANKLNIRSSDSTSGNIIGVYLKDEIVLVYAQSKTGWYLTSKGWISNNYARLI